MAYSKLHSSIVYSSLWTQPDAARILFITLLALADQDGCVYGSNTGIARVANIEPGDVDEAFRILMSPDAESSDTMRAPEHEGKRIVRIPGGFQLLNYEYYRNLRNDDDRREQNRLAQQRFRFRQQASSDVSNSKQASSDVSISHQKSAASAQAEAEAEAEAVSKGSTVDKNSKVSKGEKVSRFAPPSLEEISLYVKSRNSPVSPEAFFHFYQSKGWRVGNQPMKDWKSAIVTWEKRERGSAAPEPQAKAPDKKFNCDMCHDEGKVHQDPKKPGPRLIPCPYCSKAK